jgi:hypothetical protein
VCPSLACLLSLSYVVERAISNTLEEGRGLWEEVEEVGEAVNRGVVFCLFLLVLSGGESHAEEGRGL